MQKIYMVEYSSDTKKINEFMGATGKIISVTPQKVGEEGTRGKFIIVADDGNGETLLKFQKL